MSLAHKACSYLADGLSGGRLRRDNVSVSFPIGHENYPPQVEPDLSGSKELCDLKRLGRGTAVAFGFGAVVSILVNTVWARGTLPTVLTLFLLAWVAFGRQIRAATQVVKEIQRRIKELEQTLSERNTAIAGLQSEIRGRTMAEKELEDRERSLRDAVDAGELGVWHRDLNTGNLEWNKACLALFGFPPETKITLNQLLEVVHPEDWIAVHRAIDDAVLNHTPYEHEYRVIWPDASEHWLKCTGITRYDNQGKALRLEGVACDITKRKRVEITLRDNEELLRLLLDGIGDYAIYMLDPQGHIASWNTGAARIKGYTTSEVIGQPISMFYTLEDQARDVAGQAIHDALAFGRFEAEGQRIRKDGSIFWAHVLILPMFDAEGKLRGFSKVLQDISARKRIEEALSEQAVVLDLTQVFVRDLESRIVLWNAGSVKFYGFSKAEALGQISHALLRTKFSAPLTSIERQLEKDGFWEGELTHRRKDGSTMVVTSTWLLQRDAKGRPFRILETNTDITQRKKDEQEIRRLQDETERRVVERTAQLQAANHELEAFTYSVAHDLRAPLRHIAGFSGIVLEEFGEVVAPEARHYLNRIHEGTKRMGQLVDEMLNLARVGRHALDLRPTPLNDVVRDLLPMFQADCIGRRVDWNIANLPTVDCDPILVKQVFQNLLANSLKFTRTRSAATIEVGCEAGSGQTTMFVRDNGVGFNMKYADKLFGVFQRLHRAEEFEGTGVGLATVARIVRKHGGSIWADSTLDGGATFYFTLGASREADFRENLQAVGVHA